MRQYVRGSTMLAKMDVRSNGALGDPGSTKCTIIDPLGTKQVNAASMSRTATGKYEYSYTIPKGQKYVKSPVPLYESDIDFTFSFDRLREVESFFSLILDQHEFPLKISSLDIQRDSGERATCTIKTSFVIPIKQQPRTSARE